MKQAMVRFVDDTTRPGAPGFVPPAERIAVFDNDGTLWVEQPLYIRAELQGGTPTLVRDTKIDFVDDGPGKPVGIYKQIGRRPILAVGNSDGDWQMLQYTMAGAGPRLA